MDPLTLRGFLTIAALSAVAAVVVIGPVVALTMPVGLDVVAGVLFGSFMIGLGTAGVAYLVCHALEIRNLRLPAEGLRPGEEVVLFTPGSVAHFPSGRPGTVGGRLFLTDRRLIFTAFRGQGAWYSLAVPLTEVAAAAAGSQFGAIPGRLKVTTIGGREESFTFGVVRELEAERFAAAILLARYRLDPYWGAEPPP